MLEILLHRFHLLMMSLDCPLATHHKKWEYIHMEIGGDWRYRLYLGAHIFMYFGFGYDVFILALMCLSFLGCIC